MKLAWRSGHIEPPDPVKPPPDTSATSDMKTALHFLHHIGVAGAGGLLVRMGIWRSWAQ